MPTWDNCHIRDMRSDDLPQVLHWRNQPEVRRYMLTQHEITLEEHRAWFERASEDATRRLLIVTEQELPLGFVHFTGVEEGGIADWGLYTVPDAQRGTGRKIGATALSYAFTDLGLHKVCGQALAYNQASRRLHLALGFCEEGVLRDQHHINGAYHDLVCFGLLARECIALQFEQINRE